MTKLPIRLSVLTFLLALLGSASAPQRAQAQPLERRWSDELAAEARGADGLGALAALVELGAIAEWLPPEQAQTMWSDLAGDLEDPVAAAWARYAALRTARLRGDDAGADVLERDLGFVTGVEVMGPFPNDGMQGLVEPFGPELDGYQTGDTYAGRFGEVGWRAIGGASETGYIDLADFMHPAHNVAVYVAFEIPARRAGSVALDLAVDGAYRLWLNGVPVAEQRSALGGVLTRDEHSLRVRAGSNQVLLKIAVADGPFGLHARILDTDAVMSGPARAPTRSAGPVREVDVWSPAPTAASRYPDPPPTAEGRAARALVLSTLQPEDPAEPWVGDVEAVTAASEAPPAALVRAALATREHWLRVELLERARDAGGRPQLAWALAHLAELGTAPLEQVRGVVAATDELPGALRLEFARAARDLGFTHVWAAEVDALLAEYGPVRAVLPDALAVARDLARGRDETELLRRRWEMDRLNPTALADWLARCRLNRDSVTAASVLSDALARAPYRRGIRLAAAHHLAASGDLPGAIGQIDVRLGQSPDDVDARIERARMLVRAGRDDEAIAELEQALARRQQDEAARQLLAALRPAIDEGQARWRVPIDELVQTAAALRPEDGVDTTVLVDQRVVEVHSNGLSSAWTQQAYVAHTRAAADELGTLGIGYSPDSELVEVLSVQVIAPDGTVRTAYEQTDYGPQPGPAAMYFDVHTRALRFPAVAPGDVLVYEYRLSQVATRNIFDDYFGDIFVVQGEDPVALSRYVAIMPPGRTLQTSTVLPAAGSWQVEPGADGATVYVHEARDVPRVVDEANLPGWSETQQWLSVSTYSSWDTLARWYWALIERQLVMTPPMQQVVDELVAGLDSDEQIVEAIHEYVVRNIRYVGLEFGVHGYKPYRTSEIFERRFGDCKDTASLMKVMLNAAGVEAHLVLIRTRDQGRVPAEPPSLALFNHAIVWVPALDLYLDGTAGFSGYREVPSADQGASALLVLDGRGGEFVETPFSSPSSNVDRTEATVDLRGAAPAGRVIIGLSGVFAAGARAYWEAEEGREAAIERGLAQRVAGIELTVDEVIGVAGIREPVRVRASFAGGEWTRGSGENLRVPVSPGRSSLVASYAPSSTRLQPTALPSPATTQERFTWLLPEGCALDAYAPVSIDSPFGNFAVAIEGAGDAPTVSIALVLRAARIEVADHDAFRTWLTQVDGELNRELGMVCQGQVNP